MLLRSIIVILFIFSFSKVVSACESCSIARLGRDGGVTSESEDGRWFFNYLYENQNWHEREAGESHQLHHQGHDAHAKLTEEFHHFTIGGNINDRLMISTEIPYVVRRSLEVDNHAILGKDQRSQGMGDLRLLGDLKVLRRETSSVSVIGGVKFPTGSTKETNTVDTRFEPELQPGSGSYDYLLGGVYREAKGRANLTGNIVYVFKNEGAQDFRYGNLLSTTFTVDYLTNPNTRALKTRFGLDANIQYEQRQKNQGETVKDSGGVTLLMGPTVTIEVTKRVALSSAFLLPAYQDVGGVHQTLDFVWTLSGNVQW